VNTDQAHDAVRRALGAVAPEADLSTVDSGERLRDALDIDSLDFLSLVETLHDLTGVEIPEADYAKVETLNGLVGYLSQHAA
jgi:acyl carrier protein